ncbi:MAG: hypothetical protein ACREBD_07260 [Blastocatellia bacterium]
METGFKTKTSFIVFLALSLAASVAFAQQPISPEKKRAMHRFDPVDIFPEAQDRARDSTTERRGRRRRGAPAASGDGTATPPTIAGAATQPTPSATLSVSTTPLVEPSPAATTAAAPKRGVSSLAAAANAPPQMMGQNASLNSSSPANDQNGDELLWSLPVILGLFAIVLLALIALVLALMKQLRKS